jgi:hypothetical protein
MSERQKVEERLRKKEQELQSLEEKLRVGRVYVQALRDVLKLLTHEIPQPDDPAHVESAPRQGSAVAQAREVILQRGEPVHVNELLQALQKDTSREARASLTSSLAAYVRRGEIFTRPAPNTFGLTELGHNTPKGEAVIGPPTGFGRMSPKIETTKVPSIDDDDGPPF